MKQFNIKESIMEFYPVKLSLDVAHRLSSITRKLSHGVLQSSNKNKGRQRLYAIEDLRQKMDGYPSLS